MRRRHVGLNLGIIPSFDLDLDVGLFHGFANLGLVMPMVSKGGLVPFSLGLGVGIPAVVRSAPNLKLDLFVLVNVMGDAGSRNSDVGWGSGNWISLGVGLGLHHTWDNGFTLGFTVPIVGYDFDVERAGSLYANVGSYGLSRFYSSSAQAMPLVFLGYRI